MSRAFFAAFWLLIIFVAATDSALADTWQQANRDSAALIEAGNLEGAAKRAEDALTLYRAKDSFRATSYGALALNLVDINDMMGKFDRGDKELQAAIRVVEKRASPTDDIVFSLYEELAGRYGQGEESRYERVAGRYYPRAGASKEIQVWKTVIARSRDRFGDSHFQTAFYLLQMAMAEKSSRGYKLIVRRLLEADKIMTENYPADHPTSLLIKIELAKSELEEGHLENAEEKYLAIRESLRASDGDLVDTKQMLYGQMAYLYERMKNEEGMDRAMADLLVIAPVNSEALLVVQVFPKTPEASKYSQKRQVTVAFTILSSGRVVDPRIISASGRSMWDEKCLAAVREWRYVPKTVDGVAVQSTAQHVFVSEF